MSSSDDSGSEDWRWDSSTISEYSVPSELSDREIPEGYLQQEIKTSCRIQSCKSIPQPLTGRAGAGRGAYRFEPEIVKKAEMQGGRSGLQLLQGFSDDHDDVDQRFGNNDW